ncbi:MAG: hypothetical protein AB7G24_00935 [Novosphingobium sp.]
MTSLRILEQGRRALPFGHLRYCRGVLVRTTDNQPSLLPAILRERARRALYAGCDPAPFNWEKAR